LLTQLERDRNSLAVTLADVRKELEADRQEAVRRQVCMPAERSLNVH
jgi:hypothetical protein